MANEECILLNLTTTSRDATDNVKIRKRKLEQQYSTRSKHAKSSNADNIVSNEKAVKFESSAKFQVISSLFEKNPAIPNISSIVVEQNEKRADNTFCQSDFGTMPLTPYMITNLEQNLLLKKMTSVQKESIPPLLSGKDVFIQSPTGTGKTLSYVIPVVQSLQAITPKIKRNDGPYCLVLVPTRELASQTLSIMKEVLKPFIWIVPGCVVGGEKRKSEKSRIRKGINILVATPGRLVDHLKNTTCLTLSKLQWLVLDEADRLLDLGFEKDISYILSTIQEHNSLAKVQKVLLSATLSQGVKSLVDFSMDCPVTINMCDESEVQTPSQLRQFCMVVPLKLRLVTLATFLQKKSCEGKRRIIVFFTTQDSVDFHYTLFSAISTTVKDQNLRFMKLHGSLSQSERVQVFSSFRDCEGGILLCTDVVARGVDLPSVDWIVQFNPPVNSADYVHRVGRTARIGASGQALLFLLPSEVAYLELLSQQNLRLSELKIEEILSTSRRDSKQTRGVATEMQMKFEELVCENSSIQQLASTAFRSFIGAYNTFPSSLKHIFHPRNLHLGHLAKSFALRETPNEIKENYSKQQEKRAMFNTKSRRRKECRKTHEPLSKKTSKKR